MLEIKPSWAPRFTCMQSQYWSTPTKLIIGAAIIYLFNTCVRKALTRRKQLQAHTTKIYHNEKTLPRRNQIGIPRIDKAAAHIIQGSHVTYRVHFENLLAMSAFDRPFLCHCSSKMSMASISACLVACTSANLTTFVWSLFSKAINKP